jgi:type IV secretory pathway VirB2 component (pilin)
MWITLLAMAVAVSLEPFRIGMTVLMINRPRPLLQLLAFLTGGFAMGITVGVIVLFVLRPALGSAHFTLPRVQIVVGVVLLVNAAVVAAGVVGKRGDAFPSLRVGPAGRADRRFEPLSTRTRQLLNGRSLWTAGVAGLGIALPSVDYLAVLALIVASGAAASVQVGALLLFNVVAFGFVEIPLFCYLAAPDRTRATLSALQDWLRTRRRSAVTILLAAVGCVLLGAGLAGL